MAQSEEEAAQVARLDSYFALARSAVLRRITNKVCDCGHIGLSNANRSEADKFRSLINMGKDTNLLDLGAGAGWPGLYFAEQSGCRVTLLDLPKEGLKIASERAEEVGISDRVHVVNGDASMMPFKDGTFSAITHSDVLCCLLPKRKVLEECRRVVVEEGQMAFSVIYIASGLSRLARADAVDAGPDFVETEGSYENMLAETGWRITAFEDVTSGLARTYEDLLSADRDNETELRNVAGDDYFESEIHSIEKKLSAVQRGLLKRSLFFVETT